uniref:Clp1 P-loop domain-containing protein n=1 Tax=Desulfobacca acetoxidans TaxID=60893 RepID=A0A7V4G8C8_9BACT
MSPDFDKTFPFLKNLDLPPAWEAAARRFLEGGGVTLVLGGTDTGKSTLCTYLVYRAYTAGLTVALLDLDLGQSHLGPPGSLGLNLYPPRFPGDAGLFPEGLYFIGQTSPVGAVLEVAVGARVLADYARSRGVTRLVVNTSGLIQGPAAHRLKRAKVELLQPRLLPALSRGEELAPLLAPLGAEEKILSLPVSARALIRTPEERRQYREHRFRRYFKEAQVLELPLASLRWRGYPFGWGLPLAPQDLLGISRRLGTAVWYGTGAAGRLTLLVEHLPPESPLGGAGEALHLLTPDQIFHHLVGLWGTGPCTLALGLLVPSDWRRGRLALLTPLPPSRVQEVRALSLGTIRLESQGREF